MSNNSEVDDAFLAWKDRKPSGSSFEEKTDFGGLVRVSKGTAFTRPDVTGLLRYSPIGDICLGSAVNGAGLAVNGEEQAVKGVGLAVNGAGLAVIRVGLEVNGGGPAVNGAGLAVNRAGLAVNNPVPAGRLRAEKKWDEVSESFVSRKPDPRDFSAKNGFRTADSGLLGFGVSGLGLRGSFL